MYVLLNSGNSALPKVTQKSLIGRTTYVLLNSGAQGVKSDIELYYTKNLSQIPFLLKI